MKLKGGSPPMWGKRVDSRSSRGRGGAPQKRGRRPLSRVSGFRRGWSPTEEGETFLRRIVERWQVDPRLGGGDKAFTTKSENSKGGSPPKRGRLTPRRVDIVLVGWIPA